MRTLRNYFFAGLAVSLAACSTPSIIGSKPDVVPPKLVKSGIKAADGTEYITWDNPRAFGPIPDSLKAAGDTSCMWAGIEFEAIGFHPGARGLDGAPIPQGGYFCNLKKHGSEPAKTSPKLVVRDGLLGWDKPNLFGKVPDDLKANGIAVCSKLNSQGVTYRPLAYHPTALDQQGRPIDGGGFFCVQN
jgi:hypothetical protein